LQHWRFVRIHHHGVNLLTRLPSLCSPLSEA
jgi:hypothetical protein